jgi:site-specific DNA-adenine methylase
MTIQEVRNTLNEFFPPKRRYSRNIEFDKLLTEDEIKSLCDYVIGFEEQDNKYEWKSNLHKVTDVAIKYQPKSIEIEQAQNNSSSIPDTKQVMPFLIHQVLFYTGVACGLYKLANQTEILAELKANGLSLSHNYFTRLRVTAYVETLEYNQPQMLFNYSGQKHEELAVAIKNLVYQAGQFNNFCDVFGGSGAASVAFPRSQNAVYTYNDKDPALFNLFEVVSDDKDYLKLIDMCNQLVEDLNGGNIFNPDNLKFDEIVDNYHSNRKNNPRIKMNDNELDAIALKNSEVEIKDYRKIMRSIYEYTKEHNLDEYYELFAEHEPVDDSYLAYIFFTKYDYFVKNILDEHYIKQVYEYAGKTTDYYTFRDESRHLRFYTWYAVFDRGVVFDDKVLNALGTIYLNSFLIKSQKGISAINLINRSSNWNKNNDWKAFIEKDWNKVITTLHERLKKNEKKSPRVRQIPSRFLVMNEDFKDAIDIVKSSKTLYYVDSPYLYTKQYSVNKKADIFDEKAMRTLLETLKNSKGKFIFSCRACKSEEENANLMEYLFKPFKEIFKNKLYVLTIGKSDFWGSVKENKIAEIMITNFEIFEFRDKSCSKVNFSVYKYNDFLDKLKVYLKI